MVPSKRKLAFSAAIVGIATFIGAVPAVAEDAFLGWGTVPSQELAEERGMAAEVDEQALAKAVGSQQQYVTITSGDVLGDAGDNNYGTHTFAGQVMSVNIFNTGHNNAIQVQNVVAVTIVDGVPQ